MNVLDLFSGIGGFSLGLEAAGFQTAAFCEIEDYPRKVLAKHWPGVPIYDDVRTLTAERLIRDGVGGIDIICGGFPCQDISTAGKGAGIEGERSGLWSEIARLIGELRPRYAIMENVSALLGRGLDKVLGDLAALGYDAEWHCIPASELGAHHHRDRVWIIAYPKELQRDGLDDNAGEQLERGEISEPRDCSGSPDVADSQLIGQQGQGQYEQSLFAEAYRKGQTANAFAGGVPEIWQTEPDLGRVVDGVPDRSHRLKCLGNAVCPPVVEVLGGAIMAQETNELREYAAKLRGE
jgi:DNA (cytosine-5)-methyltransferase 1